MNKTWRRILLSILVLAGSSFTMSGPIAGHAAPGSAVPSEAVTVYLHTSALIEGPQYTLGQIASVYGSDPARSQTLGQLPLGPAPVRPTLLPARVIQERVAAAAGQAVVIGGRVALLPAETIDKDQRWFFTALLAFVESLDACKLGRIEIELLNSPLLLESIGNGAGRQQVLASGWEDRVVFELSKSPYSSGFRSALSSTTIPAGTMQMRYRVLAPAGAGSAGGQTTGDYNASSQMMEGSFRIWIHHFLPVARAAVDLPAGGSLSEEAVIFSEEDVSLLQSSFVVQGEEIHGYKILSSLRQGERIDGRLLQRAAAVRAGDRVMITVARPGLRVTLPGRALRSGGVGDLIDVRPEATAKRFQARITSEGEVLVEND
jgi:flagella basal body P-ring formation protein FlgA